MKTGWFLMGCVGLGGWMCGAGVAAAAPPVAPPAPAVIEAINRGVSLMGQYQYDGAARAFAQAVQAAPGLLDAQVNLAIALFNRGQKETRDLDRAGELLQAVLKQEPEQVRALYFQGLLLAHLGKSEEALGYFEKVLRRRPEEGVTWYLLGMCQQRVGQPAEPSLLRAVQYRPNLYSAYYKLYQLAALAGQTDKAKEYMEKFKQLRESPLGEAIELPQYNQMGDLALARPLDLSPAVSPTRGVFTAAAPTEVVRWVGRDAPAPASARPTIGGLAMGDFNRDGILDAVVAAPSLSGGSLVLLLGKAPGRFTEATASSGLQAVTNALSCAVGDFDNDEIPDLFVAGVGGNWLFKGRGDGTFTNVTAQTGLGGGHAVSRSALFLDADHDGDLDLFVCNAGTSQGASPAACELWNNNGDGAFTNIAASAGVACPDSRAVAVLAGDLDGDRDTDLVLLCDGRPARLFFNDLLGHYHEGDWGGLAPRGELGGALQDFDGDGTLDLLVLGGDPPQPQLFLGDGRGHFRASTTFGPSAAAVAAQGACRGLRVVDLDLDGDLDIVCFGREGMALLNDGRGRFALQPGPWTTGAPGPIAAVEVCDLTGDGTPDCLTVLAGAPGVLALSAGRLVPPATALILEPTGMRGRDKRTRSPASGYGVSLTARTGLREQRWVEQGLSGGPCQSSRPVVFGLAGAPQADYVQLQWPDGVTQVETALRAGPRHKIAETQRKISSCPVLFAWNGQRFGFVTDFAGVGGLGYFSAPGVYAPPQVLEHIKIEPGQLRPRDGFFELRVTEPMEEAAYVDRLELLAIDHPAGQTVFPDERLALAGPPPTHELLVAEEPIFAVRATGPRGEDGTEALRQVDRVYAFEPPLDRRFVGFCRPHTLELDFGDRLSKFGPRDRVFLFLNGSIEYPYSSTIYAASQARVGWEPIRIERQDEAGQWHTLVPDAGAPGGMARTITVELTGRLGGPRCRLRLSSNLEIFYDRVFVARHAGPRDVTVRTVPLAAAALRRVGFAREVSPDGRLPLLYEYDLPETTAPFLTLRGAYTRYGEVKELLAQIDDRYVIMGPGEEIALRFTATPLPAPAPGRTRSFILVSHAYCKDMDLYTGTPRTLEPLPFQAMSRYPYPPAEHYPDTPAHRRYRQEYNTRPVP